MRDNPTDVIRERVEALLSRSSEKVLSKRKLGRGKKGIALNELRDGLAGIVEYLDDIGGEVTDHSFDSDTIARLADKSWGSEELKRQQASLKRTMTEIGKATSVIDKLILVVGDQTHERQYSYSDVSSGAISSDEYFAQKNPVNGLIARRDELGRSLKTVRELRDAIESAKDVKRWDEKAELARVSGIKHTLKSEIKRQLDELTPPNLVALMSALRRSYFEPSAALRDLERGGIKSHLRYLTNSRSRFVEDVLDEVHYKFTCKPDRVGMLSPLAISEEFVASEIGNVCRGVDAVKMRPDYKGYVELYKSAQAIQSAISSGD